MAIYLISSGAFAPSSTPAVCWFFIYVFLTANIGNKKISPFGEIFLVCLVFYSTGWVASGVGDGVGSGFFAKVAMML